MIFKIEKAYRVKDWIHFLGFTILGFFYYTQPLEKLPILLLNSSLLLAYAYSFNNYVDLKQKRLIVPIIPLIMHLLIIPFLQTYTLVLSLFFIITATTYSMPILKLKSIPIIGTLLNPIGFVTLESLD